MNWAFLWFHHQSVTGIAWSLSVEEHFYLLWPLLVRRYQTKSLVRIVIGTIIACCAVRCLAVVAFEADVRFFYFNTFSRSDSLAVGALLALCFRHQSVWVRWRKVAMRAFAIEIVVVGLISYSDHFLFLASDPAVKTIGYTVVALFWATVLTIALDPKQQGNIAFRIGSAHWLQVLGKYSVSIYLTHQALNLFLARHFWNGIPNAGTAIYRLAVIPGTDDLVALGVGWLTWHVLENMRCG
jgi:peptidoglycan/LPS O-acetylase OafA/YrhL